MRYPCLVDKRFCKTEIHIEIEPEGVNEYGEPQENVVLDLLCNYQDSAKTVYTADKKLIQLTGIALFPGDIVPDLPTMSGGFVTLFGVKRNIFTGTKARNPDGTVNFTELRLI